jgi:hypothetical protein
MSDADALRQYLQNGEQDFMTLVQENHEGRDLLSGDPDCIKDMKLDHMKEFSDGGLEGHDHLSSVSVVSTDATQQLGGPSDSPNMYGMEQWAALSDSSPDEEKAASRSGESLKWVLIDDDDAEDAGSGTELDEDETDDDCVMLGEGLEDGCAYRSLYRLEAMERSRHFWRQLWP